jgi:processive 1,2-diacylglycerol beta-glucosyltransferase
VGPLAELALRVAGLPSRPQVVVVCGTNARLQAQVSDLATRAEPGAIRAVGFTHEVDVWLEACDLLVGKAGGLTCSEALVKGVPIVVFRPTPGQEVRNAEFLERHGAGLHADSADEVELTVGRWLSNPEELERRRQAALSLGRPRAAATIAARVLAAADDPAS